MRNTIAVAGNMIIDKIKLLRTFPARHELTSILSVEESLGGAACNVGMDLARLDPLLPVRIFGVAGADADGDKVFRAFRAFPKIDVSQIRRRGAELVYRRAHRGAGTCAHVSDLRRLQRGVLRGGS